MKEKTRKAGRPKLPKGEVKQVVAIRLSDEDLRHIEATAKQAGQPNSKWIRSRLLWNGVSEDTMKALHDELRVARSIGIVLAQKSKNSKLHALVEAIHRAEGLLDNLKLEVSMSRERAQL